MRSLSSFVLAVAVLIVSLVATAESRANTDDDFATAFLAAPLADSGTVFSSPSSPIAVTLPLWDNDYKWQEGHGYVGWDKATNSPNADGYLMETGYGDVPGLAIGLKGDMEYRPGGATWSYTAPGTTRIASAQMNLSYRNQMFAHHCLGVGLRNNDGNRHLVENCSPPEPDSQTSYDVSLADPSNEPTSKEAFFNVRMPICNNSDDTPCSKWIPSLDLIKNGPLARLHKVDMVLVDDDLPVVTPSGPFYELNGTYIDGRQSYGLTVDATDAGAGIKRMDIDHLNNPQLANKDAACDPAHHTPSLGSRICPPEDQIDMVVDTNPMPEGTRRFDANAKDPAENIGHTPWTVIIDRTPPPAPSLRFMKPEEGSGQVEWDAAQDPVLPDGTPGSQTTWYRYRSQINGGSWTDWHEIPASRRISNEVYDQPIGTAVRFEVQAIDLVRNTSESSFVESTVDGRVPAASLSGSLLALDNTYVRDGNPGYSLGGVDEETGVEKLQLIVNEGVSVETAAPCTPAAESLAPGKRRCPREFTVDGSLGFEGLGSGRYVVSTRATDRATNVGLSTGITILVDKTPPGPPENLEFGSDADDAQGAWDAPEDPEIADGVPGSGVAGYLWKFRSATLSGTEWTFGAWSDLAFTQNAHTDSIDGLESGTLVEFEVRTVDVVGNESEALLLTGTVSDDVDDDGDGLLQTPSVTFEQAGEATSNTCTLPAPAGLAPVEGEFGRYMETKEYSVEDCSQTMEMGVVSPVSVVSSAAASILKPSTRAQAASHPRPGLWWGASRYTKLFVDPPGMNPVWQTRLRDSVVWFANGTGCVDYDTETWTGSNRKRAWYLWSRKHIRYLDSVHKAAAASTCTTAVSSNTNAMFVNDSIGPWAKKVYKKVRKYAPNFVQKVANFLVGAADMAGCSIEQRIPSHAIIGKGEYNESHTAPKIEGPDYANEHRASIKYKGLAKAACKQVFNEAASERMIYMNSVVRGDSDAFNYERVGGYPRSPRGE